MLGNDERISDAVGEAHVQEWPRSNDKLIIIVIAKSVLTSRQQPYPRDGSVDTRTRSSQHTARPI